MSSAKLWNTKLICEKYFLLLAFNFVNINCNGIHQTKIVMNKSKVICERLPTTQRTVYNFSCFFCLFFVCWFLFWICMLASLNLQLYCLEIRKYLSDSLQLVSPIPMIDFCLLVLSILPSFSNCTLRKKRSTERWIATVGRSQKFFKNLFETTEISFFSVYSS